MINDFDVSKKFDSSVDVRKRFIEAGIIGFFVGWTGLASFMVKRKSAGIYHLVLLAISPILFYGGEIMVNYEKAVCAMCPAFTNPLKIPGICAIILGIVIAAINVIWGIIEGLSLLWFGLNISLTSNGKEENLKNDKWNSLTKK